MEKWKKQLVGLLAGIGQVLIVVGIACSEGIEGAVISAGLLMLLDALLLVLTSED